MGNWIYMETYIWRNTNANEYTSSTLKFPNNLQFHLPHFYIDLINGYAHIHIYTYIFVQNIYAILVNITLRKCQKLNTEFDIFSRLKNTLVASWIMVKLVLHGFLSVSVYGILYRAWWWPRETRLCHWLTSRGRIRRSFSSLKNCSVYFKQSH